MNYDFGRYVLGRNSTKVGVKCRLLTLPEKVGFGDPLDPVAVWPLYDVYLSTDHDGIISGPLFSRYKRLYADMFSLTVCNLSLIHI